MSNLGGNPAWHKGMESANPSGKSASLERSLRSLRNELMARTGGAQWFASKLMDIVKDAPDYKDKLTALKLMMEYGYGKPVQNVQLDGLGEGGVQIVVNTGVLQPERLVPTQAKVIESNPLIMNEMAAPEVEGPKATT